MLRKLYKETERVRAGRAAPSWCSIDVIVRRPEDVDVLAFAVDQKWIEVSPDAHSVTLTEAGRRLVGKREP